MVEDEHAITAGHILQRALDLRVIDGLYLIIVIEVRNGGIMVYQAKSFAVE